MNNYLDIIKYRGTKRFFAALGKINDKWLALIAPVITIDMYGTLNTNTVFLGDTTSITFPAYEDVGTNIHFKINESNNTYYHLISLNDEKDFNIVIATLESVYGAE